MPSWIRKKISPFTTKLLVGLRRKLRLTPFQKVISELKKRNVEFKGAEVIELFGGSGCLQTADYASKVKSLEIWEIDPKYEPELRSNFPDAAIRITDTYREIKKSRKKFDVILVDNPTITHGGHHEHFDLFPDVFRIAKDSCILVVNVIPELRKEFFERYSINLEEVQLKKRLEARRTFYGIDQPEKVGFDEMVKTYKKLAEQNGFEVEWYFSQKRTFVHYLVMKIIRK